MKRFIILLTINLFILSCTVKEKPEFLNVDNIRVETTTSKYITITADALFINPNDIGGNLKTDDLKVFVNNNQLASISTENFKVPAKEEFSVPLKVNIPTDSIFNNKNLGGLIGSLLSKKIKIQYKGDIKYKTFGFSYTYDVDKTDYLKIKF